MVMQKILTVFQICCLKNNLENAVCYNRCHTCAYMYMHVHAHIHMQEIAQVASWVEQDRPGIPEVMKLNQEDEEFKTNLNHMMRLSQDQNISGTRLSSSWHFPTLPSSLHVLETVFQKEQSWPLSILLCQLQLTESGVNFPPQDGQSAFLQKLELCVAKVASAFVCTTWPPSAARGFPIVFRDLNSGKPRFPDFDFKMNRWEAGLVFTKNRNVLMERTKHTREHACAQAKGELQFIPWYF